QDPESPGANSAGFQPFTPLNRRPREALMRKRLYFTILAMALSSTSALANTRCFEHPEGASVDPAKKQPREQMMRDTQNPAQDLLLCFMQTAFQGPKAVLDSHCGCKEAVMEMCEFKKNEGLWVVTAKGAASFAWCVAFL